MLFVTVQHTIVGTCIYLIVSKLQTCNWLIFFPRKMYLVMSAFDNKTNTMTDSFSDYYGLIMHNNLVCASFSSLKQFSICSFIFSLREYLPFHLSFLKTQNQSFHSAYHVLILVIVITTQLNVSLVKLCEDDISQFTLQKKWLS